VRLISKTAVFSRLRNCAVAIIFITASVTNSGCTSLPFLSDTPVEKTPVEIHYTSPDRISFQGKGAGAGIALMSSMGPVGIAIGVAIDEGIAKDIRDTANAGDVDFKALLKDSVATMDTLKDADRIDIKRYGFVMKNGSKDYVAAEVRVTVIKGDITSDVTLSSWFNQEVLKDWVTLDDVKTKPEAIEKLFVMALK
jgi:hypothetical protein